MTNPDVSEADVDDSIQSKECGTCAALLPLSAFGLRKGAPDGRRAHCNPCRNDRRRALYRMTEDERAADHEARREPRPADEKTCSACGQRKAAAEFGLRLDRPSGLRSRCFECERARGRADHARNRVARNAASRAWRKNNPEAWRESYTRYRAENAERVAEERRERYRNASEEEQARRAENQRRFHEANPDYAAQWREKNREAAREYGRRYRERWPNLNRERVAARRTIVDQTPASDIDLVALWDGRCGICGEPLDAAILYPDPLSKSVDHIFPLAHGGQHVQSNLQWAHLRCNFRKGASLPMN